MCINPPLFTDVDKRLKDIATTECGCNFYISGGWVCDEETASLQTSEQIVRYNPKTNKSEVFANMTGARGGHIMNCIKGLVSTQDILLICGGYEPKGLIST